MSFSWYFAVSCIQADCLRPFLVHACFHTSTHSAPSSHSRATARCQLKPTGMSHFIHLCNLGKGSHSLIHMSQIRYHSFTSWHNYAPLHTSPHTLITLHTLPQCFKCCIYGHPAGTVLVHHIPVEHISSGHLSDCIPERYVMAQCATERSDLIVYLTAQVTEKLKCQPMTCHVSHADVKLR